MQRPQEAWMTTRTMHTSIKIMRNVHKGAVGKNCTNGEIFERCKIHPPRAYSKFILRSTSYTLNKSSGQLCVILATSSIKAITPLMREGKQNNRHVHTNNQLQIQLFKLVLLYLMIWLKLINPGEFHSDEQLKQISNSSSIIEPLAQENVPVHLLIPYCWSGKLTGNLDSGGGGKGNHTPLVFYLVFIMWLIWP